MSAIHDWLNGNRDFDAGVKLFTAYGGSEFYQKMFSNAGQTEFNKKKLASELEKLAGAVSPAPPAQKMVVPKPEQKPVVPTPENKAADNRKYLDLTRKKDNLYTRLNMLVMEKRYLPSGEKLRQCAFDILKTHQAITECWAQIDYFQEHQTFPTQAPEPVRDDKTRIQYLQVSISKAKTRLKSPKCRNRATTELLIKQKEAELAQLTYKPKPE
jgi:hypothetical protein